MFQTLGTVLVIVVGGFCIARRADVRLVLALSATVLFVLAGRLPEMFAKMAAEMAKPDTVVPICSAVGFAYVLRLTECDKHLVHLLLRPMRLPFMRALLIPGGIAVGYLVNMAVVSQTGVAAVVGPILIPLLLANGLSPLTAGSLLLLGSSMGGELFNPGAVEIVTLSDLTKITPVGLILRTAPVNLLACTTALLVYWRLAVRYERRKTEMGIGCRVSGVGEQEIEGVKGRRGEGEIEGTEPTTQLPNYPTPDTRYPTPLEALRVHPVKAVVPVIPLALLIVSHLLALTHKIQLPKEFNNYVTILVAMLIGVTAAALTSPRKMGQISGAFFEGAGFGYTHVISLIVIATIFTEGIKANRLIERLVGGLSGQPVAAILACLVLPWTLATVSGSGIAPAVAVMKALIPGAQAMHLNPAQMGTLTAMAAHFGRTMSPAAAVVMMCATLSGAEPLALARRVMPPLLAGGGVLFLIGLVQIVTA